MDEIREIDNISDKSIYSMRIYSDRLKTLSRVCPDDGELINATGDMYLHKRTRDWFVEYYCPKDRDLILSWQPDIDALTKQIAKEVVGAGENDEL